LQAKDIKVLETEFNSEFVLRIIPKLDWDTLWNAADSVSYNTGWKFTLYSRPPLMWSFRKLGLTILAVASSNLDPKTGIFVLLHLSKQVCKLLWLSYSLNINK
jgi:hypothetical protein